MVWRITRNLCQYSDVVEPHEKLEKHGHIRFSWSRNYSSFQFQSLEWFVYKFLWCEVGRSESSWMSVLGQGCRLSKYSWLLDTPCSNYPCLLFAKYQAELYILCEQEEITKSCTCHTSYPNFRQQNIHKKWTCFNCSAPNKNKVKLVWMNIMTNRYKSDWIQMNKYWALILLILSHIIMNNQESNY